MAGQLKAPVVGLTTVLRRGFFFGTGTFCGIGDTATDHVERSNHSLVNGPHPDQHQERKGTPS
jgi:hypothetical protein